MNLKRAILFGFLIWVILFFIGWFLFAVVPNSMHILMLVIGILTIYTFSRSIINEKNIFGVGITWFVINFVMDLIFIFYLLKNETYFNGWSIWVFYVLLIVEPAVVRRFSK